MLRPAAITLGILLLAFIALQFVGPKVTNPPVTADLVAPANVKAVLATSCYNCHSNETHLWWYDRIAPASWLVARDVKRGRLHINFSTFGQLSPTAQKAMLYECVNQMQLGAMPPKNYLLLHSDAKVTPEQIDTLKKYLHPSDTVTPATTEATQAADQQFQQWIAGDGTTLAKDVKPVANGMTFLADYKNWKAVSTTDRFDNNTLRVILGNDVAQKAIAAGNIRPWPDGTAFAKIAYKQQPDANGNIWTGEFIQVEFMLKDAQKYKSSEGWQFGRWRGVDHKPYGKTENFVTECTSCHRPMEDNDFVYTMPVHDAQGEAFNATAELTGDAKDMLSGLDKLTVITSFVDRQNSTMSTLYGDPETAAHVRTSSQTSFPSKAILELATWSQQEDRHWFGGRIPGQPRCLEIVLFNPDSTGNPTFTYELFTGTPLKKVATPDPATSQARITAITSMRAAVMP